MHTLYTPLYNIINMICACVGGLVWVRVFGNIQLLYTRSQTIYRGVYLSVYTRACGHFFVYFFPCVCIFCVCVYTSPVRSLRSITIRVNAAAMPAEGRRVCVGLYILYYNILYNNNNNNNNNCTPSLTRIFFVLTLYNIHITRPDIMYYLQ